MVFLCPFLWKERNRYGSIRTNHSNHLLYNHSFMLDGR
nr:MAG TPA: hypothetical protein [Caudoviricetes sp.]DAE59083.1 MAG TPA: hypothetical protein [Caudoviricetes sp.]